MLRSAMTCYADWLEAKSGVGSQEEKQALTQVRLFFEKFGFSRFQAISESRNELAIDKSPYERAGYRLYRDSELVFYVFKSYFNEVIARGLDTKYKKTILREKGILETDKDRGRFDKLVRLGQKRTRLYVINSKIFEGEDDEE